MDNEIKGTGNSINFKYRMHDPRIGRFFALDTLAKKYPYNSPYAFCENRVIDGIELEGLEYVYYDAYDTDGEYVNITPLMIRNIGEDNETNVDFENWIENAYHDNKDPEYRRFPVGVVKYENQLFLVPYEWVDKGKPIHVSWLDDEVLPTKKGEETLKAVAGMLANFTAMGVSGASSNETVDVISKTAEVTAAVIDQGTNNNNSENGYNSSLETNEVEFVMPSLPATRIDETSTLGQGSLNHYIPEHQEPDQDEEEL